MREDNLIAMFRKPFAPPSSDNRHGFLIVPDLLRGLMPSGQGQIWVANITFIRLHEAFAYLAVILASRARWLAGLRLSFSMPRLPWKRWITRLPIAKPCCKFVGVVGENGNLAPGRRWHFRREPISAGASPKGAASKAFER